MKKTLFIGTLILCVMMLCTTEATAQTKKQKKAKHAKMEQRERQLDSLRNEMELLKKTLEEPVELPCLSVSKDNSEYLGELGVGEDIDKNYARKKAFLQARIQLQDKLQRKITVIVDNYFSSIPPTNKLTVSKQELQNQCISKIDLLMGFVENSCESVKMNERGLVSVYYAVILEKKQISDALISTAVSAGCDEEVFKLYVNKTLRME